MTAPMPAERLAETKSLIQSESSVSFHSARAKESLLLVLAEVELWRATYGREPLRGTLDRLNAAESARDRYHHAWHNARERAASATTENARLRAENHAAWEDHGARAEQWVQAAEELRADNEQLRTALAAAEERVRKEIADDLHRADLPTFAESERTDLVVKTTRAIDVRIASLGHTAPYYVPVETPRHEVRTAIDDAVKVRDYEAAAARRQELRDLDDAKAGER